MNIYGKCLNCGHELVQIGKALTRQRQSDGFWVTAHLPFDCIICRAAGSIVYSIRRDVIDVLDEPPNLPPDITAHTVPGWFDPSEEIDSVGTSMGSINAERRTSEPKS